MQLKPHISDSYAASLSDIGPLVSNHRSPTESNGLSLITALDDLAMALDKELLDKEQFDKARLTLLQRFVDINVPASKAVEFEQKTVATHVRCTEQEDRSSRQAPHEKELAFTTPLKLNIGAIESKIAELRGFNLANEQTESPEPTNKSIMDLAAELDLQVFCS